MQAAVPEPGCCPGGIVATQTFGDLPHRYHPHLHVLATDGCFYGEGMFRVAPGFNLKDLEKLFRYRALKMLLGKGRITEEFVRLIQKVFEVDPLVCTHCQGRLRVVSFIEEPAVIRRILEHLGLWLASARPISKAHSPPLAHLPSDPCISQLPAREVEDFSQLPPPQWEC